MPKDNENKSFTCVVKCNNQRDTYQVEGHMANATIAKKALNRFLAQYGHRTRGTFNLYANHGIGIADGDIKPNIAALGNGRYVTSIDDYTYEIGILEM